MNVNFALSPYCAHPVNCNNDGFQFFNIFAPFIPRSVHQVSQSPFKLHDVEKERTPGGNATKVVYKRYLGEDGLERLHMSSDETIDLIGQYVWSEVEGKVKLVSEVSD